MRSIGVSFGPVYVCCSTVPAPVNHKSTEISQAGGRQARLQLQGVLCVCVDGVGAVEPARTPAPRLGSSTAVRRENRRMSR